MNEVLILTGAGIITAWGIAHLVPVRAIVNGFGDISADNRKILMMEVLAEGLTLVFLGVLSFLVTLLGDSASTTARIVYLSVGTMLLVMAIVTLATGARTAQIPYKICPVVKIVSAVLIILGTTL